MIKRKEKSVPRSPVLYAGQPLFEKESKNECLCESDTLYPKAIEGPSMISSPAIPNGTIDRSD